MLRRLPFKRSNLSELKVLEVQHWVTQEKTCQRNPLKYMEVIGGAIAKDKLPKLPNSNLLQSLENFDHISL